MKNIRKIIALVALVLVVSSCSDEFFDVNTPSNVLSEDQVSMKTQLPYIQTQLAGMQFSMAYSAAQYDQQLASYHIGGVDTHDRTSMSGVWYRLYDKILNNLRVLKKKAVAQDNKHYLGIAQVIEALAVQMATDVYGDIPYSEAAQGSANFYPKSDTQEQIYNQLFALLDEAIVNLQAPGNGEEPGDEDMFYKGDLNQWIKAAYTLKARLYLHLTKRNGATAAQQALNALQNGFDSNGDDMQLEYDATVRNPWYTSVVAAYRTGNLSLLFSEQLIDKMNGTDYVLDSSGIDPRLPHYADNHGASVYIGAVNGSGGAGPNNTTANANLADDFWFSESSPIVLISYQEAKFIEAEANLILNQKEASYHAYIDGIKASFDKMGLDTLSRYMYLVNPSVHLDTIYNNIDMEHIMWQKYVALVTHPEVWTDMRRYDYDPNIFTDLDFPENRVTEIPVGEWPRRAVYPSGEVNLNPNIEQVEEWWSRLWWDQ